MKIAAATTTTTTIHFRPPASRFVGTSHHTFKYSRKYIRINNVYSSREENNDVGYACSRRELLLCATISSFFVAKAANAVVDENLVLRQEISKFISKGKAAGLLRLVFHDAGTFKLDDKEGGMNGSIIYELDRPENSGLEKSVKILKKARSQVDIIQQDIIAVAGAEAISVCGGPKIPVRLGRLDSMSPDPEGRLPEESLDGPHLKQCFKEKGFSTQELVALSGAHTLGSKGFGSPIVFDNSYYKILLQKPWVSSGAMTTMIGLPSDHALVEDNDCTRWVSKYAEDQELFFQDFVKAYTKLVNIGAKWRNSL